MPMAMEQLSEEMRSLRNIVKLPLPFPSQLQSSLQNCHCCKIPESVLLWI